MIDVAKILGMLNWSNDIEIQEEGLFLANQISEFDIFFQPVNFGNKAVWDNCAKILVRKSDDELEPYLDKLLEWLQDINWPGAFIILERLKIYNKALPLSSAIDNCIKIAVTSNDDIWLSNLSLLLSNSKIKKNLSNKSILKLEKYI